jgi:hypothetical protein
MEDIDIWLIAAAMMFAVFMLAVSLLAYMREREQILLAVSMVFGVFFAKALLLTLSIFNNSVSEALDQWRFDRVMDLVILVVLLLGSWKLPGRKRGGGGDNRLQKAHMVAEHEIIEEAVPETGQRKVPEGKEGM